MNDDLKERLDQLNEKSELELRQLEMQVRLEQEAKEARQARMLEMRREQQRAARQAKKEKLIAAAQKRVSNFANKRYEAMYRRNENDQTLLARCRYCGAKREHMEPDAVKNRKDGITRCMVEGCWETQLYVRGLCRNCYLHAANLIRQGKTSWARLEKAKRCKPRAGRGPFTPRTYFRTKWFQLGLLPSLRPSKDVETRVECSICKQWSLEDPCVQCKADLQSQESR